MEREQLSELFTMRLTPTLKGRLEREARRLGMRPVDLARLAIALIVTCPIQPAPACRVEEDDDEEILKQAA